MGFIEHVFLVAGRLIGAMGYWGIGLGMLLESACIPLPSELVLPIAGFMVAGGKISMLGANISVAAGSMAGSFLAYFIGRFGGRPFILKYGRYFLISEHHFYKAEASFRKFGAAAVFFGRLMPVIRTFISLPAGIAGMKLKKFFLFSLLGMLPWNFLLIFLGFKFGQNYEIVVRPFLKKYEYVVAAAIILAVFIFLTRHFLSSKKRNACV